MPRVNQEGGTGPELNVPKSIVEYRPEAQIKAYIKDPALFDMVDACASPFE